MILKTTNKNSLFLICGFIYLIIIIIFVFVFFFLVWSIKATVDGSYSQ